MSTYIVEVDSSYRDINQYQTQTDFAIKFQTNISTEYFAQGLPIDVQSTGSYEYYNNFFNQCSIDPDYSTSNLSVTSGKLIDIQKQDSTYLLSGIAFQTGTNNPYVFSINNNSGPMISLTGIQTLSPFLCSLTKNIDLNYSFNWIVFAIGTGAFSSPSGFYPGYPDQTLYTTPYTSRSISRISEQKGIFWMFDFNYTQFTIYKKTLSSLTNLYNIIPPLDDFLWSTQLAIFALNLNAEPYVIENRPWGYHILNSTFKLDTIKGITNSKAGLEIDKAQNLYVSSNFNQYSVNFVSQVATGADPNGLGNSVTENPYSTNLIYINTTGPTGSQTGGTGPLKEYFCYLTSSGLNLQGISIRGATSVAIFDSSPDLLTDFSYRQSVNLRPYFSSGAFTGTNTPCMGQFDAAFWVNYNNLVYLFISPGSRQTLTFGFNTAYKFPLYVIEIDPISVTSRVVGTSTRLFNETIIQGQQVGTTVYIPVRDQFNTIYMFSFNLSTLSLTPLSTIVVPSTQTSFPVNAYATNFGNNSSQDLTVYSSDTDQRTNASRSTFNKNRNLWILNYNISSNTWSILSTPPACYQSMYFLQIVKIKSDWYLTATYNIPQVIDIYNISQRTTPVLTSSIPFKNNRGSSYIKPYTDPITNQTNYFLNAVQQGLYTTLFNVNDPYNPTIISPNITTLDNEVNTDIIYQMFNTMYLASLSTEGYCYASIYGNNVLNCIVPVISKIRLPMARNKVNSYHYYKNNSSTFILSNNIFNKFDIGYTSITTSSSSPILVTCDTSSLYIYTIDDLFTPSLFYTANLPSSFSTLSTDIQVWTQTEGSTTIQGIYAAISFLSVCYVYYISFDLSIINLIATLSGTNISSISVGYTKLTTNPNLFLFICQQNGFVSKYNLTSTVVTFITSGTFNYNPNSTFITYDSLFLFLNQANRYVLYTLGNSPLTTSSCNVRIIDVTNLNDLFSTTPGTVSPGTTSDAISFTSYQTQNSVNFIQTIVPSLFLYGRSISSRFSAAGLTSVGGYASMLGLSNITRPPSPTVSWLNSLTSQTYIAFPTNGQNLLNHSITITNPTIYGNVYQADGTLSINLNGLAKDIRIIQSGSRTILVNLLLPSYTGAGYTGVGLTTGSAPITGASSGPNSFYFYEVSNTDFAIKYQIEKSVKSTYTDIQSHGGGSCLHNITYQGLPNWLSIVGDDTSPGGLAISNSVNSIVKDNFQNIYVVGNWNSKLDMYQSYNGTGIQTNIPIYPTNHFEVPNTQINGFVASINLSNGRWKWVLPLLGTNSILMQRIRYSTLNNTIIVPATFNSQNMYVYFNQLSVSPTGVFSFPNDQDVQYIFNNTSSSSSVIMSLDSNGVIQWSSLLFTNNANSYVNISSSYIDEDSQTIIVGGISNSTIIEGIYNISTPIQKLYAAIDPFSQAYNFFYKYSLSGTYLSSNYISFPPGATLENENVRIYSDTNEIITFNYSSKGQATGIVNCFNKDSTLGGIFISPSNSSTTYSSTFKLISYITDTNQINYSSIALYNFTGPSSTLTSSFVNYNLFILGDSDDIILNKNFIIRNSSYDSTSNRLILTLNQLVNSSSIIRKFQTINNITGSTQYYASNLAISPLYDIGVYSTGAGNSLIFSTLYNNSSTFDISKEYFFVFPQQTGSSYYTDIVPITNITYNESLKQYTMSVSNLNDLRVPSPSGSLYGPYIYISEKNYSAYYSLQWYPGSRIYAQTYLVGLYDLIIPNRPVRNSRYPGQRFLNDYPYLYLVIYNADDQDNFDPSVVNSVYDNNINVPRFALFQIPTTTFNPITNSNYFSASSSATPKIKFSPGYYRLHFKLTDDRGNVILFDNTPYKTTDSIFEGGVVPEELLNITARLAFKRS